MFVLERSTFHVWGDYNPSSYKKS